MKKCGRCLTEFEAKRSDARYCSRACRQARYRVRSVWSDDLRYDDRPSPLTVRLDDDTDAMLHFIADYLNTSRQDLVRTLIAKLIDDLMPEIAARIETGDAPG